MAWSEDAIRDIFSRKDFERGEDYFRRGRVSDLSVTSNDGDDSIKCTVRGDELYRVSLDFDKSCVRLLCTCPAFETKRSCKHLAAAAAAYMAERRSPRPADSDMVVSSLLETYVGGGGRSAMGADKARLHLKIHTAGLGYPEFSIQVGFDRLYVVKDVHSFAMSVARRETVTYGKGLTLFHGIEQFDTRSQKLILLLLDHFPEMRDIHTKAAGGQLIYRDENYIGQGSGGRAKSRFRLTGAAFDRLFEILKGERVERGDGEGAVAMAEGNPQVTILLRKGVRAAALDVKTDPGVTLFGSVSNIYAVTESAILRCSDDFRRKLLPLLSKVHKELTVSFSDMPTLCGCVMHEIGDMVKVQDPDGLLEQYLPDECVPCCYFDMQNDALTLKLKFRYGGSTYDCDSPTPASVKRNLIVEERTKQMVSQIFSKAPNGGYAIVGDEAVFDFLTGGIERFRESGEVYVTDSLMAKRIRPTAARVGLSVSDGLISLSLDTGGFPPEELEALYQSLLKKRRFHRLTDGRYLALNGSDCETLAEMSHMLQIPASDLKKGTITLPAYRGLYLDGLLRSDEGLKVQRDTKFREMVRSFKALEESDYVLPERLEGVMRPYQKVGFQWLKTLETYGFGGILADEMGLGKTIQSIAYLATAPRTKTGLTSLVVCPASLVINWGDEFKRFAPQLQVSLIMGNAAERKHMMSISGSADVWVTSYELLRSDADDYASCKFYCCVLDEGQHIKNQSTQVSHAVKRVDCRHRFVLTGTPMENRLSELWNLFDFLMPGYLFSHRGFVEKLEKPIVKSGDADSMNQLRRLVSPFMLRRLKKDVLRELPPKLEMVRRIPMSLEEQRVYHASAARARQNLTADSGKLQILAALTELRQICCAPRLCFSNYDGPDSKLDAAMELCAGMVENGHQILLFSQFTSMLDIIRPRLEELGISSLTLQGSTPKEKRAQLVRSFNDGEASVFLISLKAGGTGLNLTAADVVIHYDPWWNTAVQNQATDRAHRIGQRQSVQVYKLIAQGTVEERILELQERKASLLDAVSGEPDDGILNMSGDDLLALLR